MHNQTHMGLSILAAALALGLLGDGLLRAMPWGINLGLWVGALMAAIVVLQHRERRTLDRPVVALLGTAFFFAAAMGWRASPFLQLLDVFSLTVALGLAAAYAQPGSGDLRRAGLLDYILRVLSTGIMSLFGSFGLLGLDIRWQDVPRGRSLGQVLAVVRGLILALPLLLIFGLLFISADAVFAEMVSDLLNWDVDVAFSHVALFLFWTWVSAGFLRELLLVRRSLFAPRPPALPAPGPDADTGTAPGPSTPSGGDTALPRWQPRLGMTEMATVLGLLNLLFLAFVLVQFRYLFGGAELVEATTGLTYAQYARRGFFELVAVTALVLPLLLVGHWLVPREKPEPERLFRGLAGALVLMLFVIMVSALRRMSLYVATYGLTELRLYTTAFMVWLAVLFVWFLATVLRGQRQRFAFGALVTGLAAVLMLHLLNPDARIVRTNIARAVAASQGQQPDRESYMGLDAHYLTRLSADAIPELVAAMPQLEPQDRCSIARQLQHHRDSLEQGDWRSWNWSRSRARSYLAGATALLGAECP